MNPQTSDKARLTEAKIMRKQIDQDAKLLANRIALLKLEELKANKKIEETRKKAQEIIQARCRNLEKIKTREEEKHREAQEGFLKSQENQKRREMKKIMKVQSSDLRLNRALKDVESIKRSKETLRKLIEEQKKEIHSEKTSVRNLIKFQLKDAEEKRLKMIEEKRNRIKKENDKKLKEENQLRAAKEREVARMEQEELDLIQRLQNTQLLQRSAYESLEQALCGSYRK